MITSAKTKFPHIEWVDLYDNKTMYEVAVVKRDETGNVYFIRIDLLDQIDKRRLHRLITNPNSRNFPLWELMGQSTLGNGMNALAYFHQLVKVKTVGGEIINPSEYHRGYALPKTFTHKPAEMNETAPVSESAAANAIKRGPGRPKTK